MQALTGLSPLAPANGSRRTLTVAPASPDTVSNGEAPLTLIRPAVAGVQVAAAAPGASDGDVAKALLAQLGKYPSLTATVAVKPSADGDTHVLVAGRPDALAQNRLEGVYGVMARLCSSPEIKAAGDARPESFQSPIQVQDNVYDVRLPGAQTAESVSNELGDGLKTDQTQELQDTLNHLPQGRVALLIGGPSGAGKSTLINSLQAMLPPGRKMVYFSGDMYFRDVNDPNYPRNPQGDMYLDSPQAMHMDEMASDISKLIKDGQADLPIYDFTRTPPGGPVQGYNGMRTGTNHVEMGPNDVLVIDSLHATNPAVINQLTGLNLPHTSVYLDTPSSNMRLVRRMVRDYADRSGPADRTLQAWDLSTFPGERDFIRPTLLEMDPARDLVYETQFPADVDLSRDEINKKVGLMDKYGLTPTYAAFHTPDDQFPQFVVQERSRLEAIIKSDAPAADKTKAQAALDMLNKAQVGG